MRKITIFGMAVLLSLVSLNAGNVLAKISKVETHCDMFDCYTILALDTSLDVTWNVGEKYDVDLAQKKITDDIKFNILPQYNNFKNMKMEVIDKNTIKISGQIQGATKNYWGIDIKGDKSFWNSEWWNSSWGACKNITLSGNTTPLNNYPQPINVSYESLMQVDFSDIRFISGYCNDTGSEMDHVRLTHVNSSWADFRVKTSQLALSMYYNNTTVSTASDVNAVYGNNIYLFLTFDETGSTVVDYSGTGNDGIIYGADRVAGYIGSGVRFDANNELVNVTYNPSLNVDQVSMLAWIKPSTVHGSQTYKRILDKTANASGAPYVTYTITTGGSGSTLQNAYLFDGEGSYTNQELTDYFPTTAFNRIIGSYNTTHIVAYKNITLASPKSGSTNPQSKPSETIADTTVDFLIGNHIWDETNHYAGIIDEVQLYNVSLTHQEVLNTYQSVIPTVSFDAEQVLTTSSSTTTTTTIITTTGVLSGNFTQSVDADLPFNETIMQYLDYFCLQDNVIENLTYWNGTNYLYNYTSTVCEYGCSSFITSPRCNYDPFIVWFFVIVLLLGGLYIIRRLIKGVF